MVMSSNVIGSLSTGCASPHWGYVVGTRRRGYSQTGEVCGFACLWGSPGGEAEADAVSAAVIFDMAVQGALPANR